MSAESITVFIKTFYSVLYKRYVFYIAKIVFDGMDLHKKYFKKTVGGGMK